MTAPIWTADAIAKLAFARFLVSEGDEHGTDQIQEVSRELEQLYQEICNYLSGHTKAERTIEALHRGEGDKIRRLILYLEEAMEDDSNFAERIQELAQCVTVTRPTIEKKMEQTVREDGKGYQTSIKDGKAYIGDDLYIADNSHIGSQAANVQGNLINYNFFGQLPHRAEPTKSNGARPTPPHNIPRSNPIFVDRKPEVENLHQLLQQHSLIVITDGGPLSGLGKTELAIQYSQKHLADYSGGVCWLFPKESDVGTQLIQFIKTWFAEIRIPTSLSIANQVLRCWQSWQEGQVLLVLDDVADYDQVKPYLPSESRFKVILIAQSRVWLSIPRSQHLSLSGLPPEAALELLIELVGEEMVSQEVSFAEQLCAYVGYSPLGLHTVARFQSRRVPYAS